MANNKPYIFNTSIDAVDIYQALQERIGKADSLVQMGVLDHVMETLGPEVGNFLWIITDLLSEIKELYDKLPVPTLEDNEAA